MILTSNTKKIVILDAEDIDKVKDYTWTEDSSGHIRTTSKTKRASSHRGITISIASLILGVSGKIIDHINRNPLDNRKENLRIVTHQQNCFNKSKLRISSSKYKGVRFKKKRNKWLAEIGMNGKHLHIGSFSSETEAALAYNEKAKELFGEHAAINKIN